MRRNVLAPCVVIGAGLSISCTVPRLATEVSNTSASVQRVDVEARGNERMELTVDLPPGGRAGLESWGERPRATVRTAADTEEVTIRDARDLEVIEGGTLRTRRGGEP